MNKKIRLIERDLHRIVKESVNKVLKEGSHSNIIKKPYYKLMQAIDDFEEAVNYEYNIGGEIKEMLDALNNARDKVHSWTAHPEGIHGERMWDSVGF